MYTFLTIHLVGGALAVVLQVVLMFYVLDKMRLANEYQDSLAAAIRRFGLQIDFRNNTIVSPRLNMSIVVSTALKRAPIISLGLILQSLLLGWINVLIVFLGLVMLWNQPDPIGSDIGLELAQKIAKLKDPSCDEDFIINELVEMAVSGIQSARHRAEIMTFLSEHDGAA